MAKSASLSKQELASNNLVQEIAKKGDEVPEKYILKDGFPEAIDAPDSLWKDSLLIDCSLLSSSSTPASMAELAKLRSAFSQWGCLQVINHGIESLFLEEMINVSKQFFALPVEEKLKCSPVDDAIEGYGGGSSVAAWNDGLYLTLHPEEKRKLWPEKPQKLRILLDEYSKKLANVTEVIYKAMARSLNLEEGCFINHQSKHGQVMVRFNFYPCCPRPERVLGAKPHSDGSTMTILLVEKGVETLQVQNDGHWYKVTSIPGALFINIGDMGEILTNGVFKGVVHRVITSSSSERVSVAVFYNSEQKNEIGPIDEMVSDDHPRVYKKFSDSEYHKIFYEALAQGIRPLDALKKSSLS